ncbi:MAG: FAD-dependent oxidoreductase [Cellvibrionaceae bacterium]|nr:FAD-dependent oxidoreductase [Cellvibrionaceae bacterium]
MPQQLSIAIAGAGLVGRLLSWRLLRLGHKVQLFDDGDPQHSRSAAHTAAAMISPLSEVVVSERSIYDMGVSSLAIWPRWLEELNVSAPTPVHYAAPGSLVVAHPADMAELEQFYADLRFHLGADNNARWLERRDLYDMEPDIAGQFDRALYLPDEAYLDNRHLLARLLEEIQALGGACFAHHPVNFMPEATLGEQALEGFDCIFDCRGMGARQSQKDLRGVRGEVLWAQTDEVQLRHPVRLMHPRYKLYIVPKPGNRFIIGATEIESQDRSPVSVQSMLELCSALYTLNPAFAEARILELDANLRPSYWHNLPLIEHERVPSAGAKAQNIVRINGLYRHGYLLAPTLVEDVLARLPDFTHPQTDTV